MNNFQHYIHFLSLSPLKIFQLGLIIRAMAGDLTRRTCRTFRNNEHRCDCRLGPWHCGLMSLHCGNVPLSALTSLLIRLPIRQEVEMSECGTKQQALSVCVMKTLLSVWSTISALVFSIWWSFNWKREQLNNVFHYPSIWLIPDTLVWFLFMFDIHHDIPVWSQVELLQFN